MFVSDQKLPMVTTKHMSLHKKRCFFVSKFEEYLCITWNSLAFSEIFSAENAKFSQSFPLGNRQ